MNGKEKCEMLRSIRMNIAQKYGIEYEPKECEHEECSTGTCPLCDKEAEFILEELRKRKKAGELDRIDTEILRGLEFLSKEPTDDDEEDYATMGEPVPFEVAYPFGEKLPQEDSDDDELEALTGEIAGDLDDNDQNEDEQEDDDQPLPHP
ncbi:MAG: hypothetical protein IKR05_07235 [Prevotella sp.]|nr:hypothetical protein [Prevotella sp.]